ncbi:MAG: hypothetical protein E7555_04895 [Ruminococcaceae bacterium]|nr:hypothetical protein [Oscillospiraceae bacterium]
MKKIFTKIISAVLVLTLLFSVAITGISASEKTAEDALIELDKDIPIVEIHGFGDQPIYKGLLTETEEDDVDIWSFDAETIVGLVMKYFPDLVYSMMFGKFDRIDVILTEVLSVIFGNVACNENGVPSPDTGLKYNEPILPKEEYGKENSYYFAYDWRLDMHTISTQLDEYINKVLEVTGEEEVGLVCFSLGGAVMMTYLYEHYYIVSPEERSKIHSAIFLSAAMNGVECCEDPFSGNIEFTSKSLLRLIAGLLPADDSLIFVDDLLRIVYALNIFNPIIDFTNESLVPNLDKMGGEAILSTIGTVPVFYALMSTDRYYETEDYIFNTPEKKEKFAVLLEKSRYYHDNVQANADNIISAFMEDGKNFAVISEYGFEMLPVTSDNDRMSDGMIGTYNTSFGATCAEIDGTLGENYVQKVQCECGRNHISPDNQIDASTCKYADITWFAKNLKHKDDDKFFADIIDLVTYSDQQITVHTYSDLPQFLINVDDTCLVPMTADNFEAIVPFDGTISIIRQLKELLEK